ncbi:hypothetical protein PLICRDRAFT_101378 [Plicaturopsis crispa FD-325 SS-3]|nr:hypothetical protein PLICRDRAFT_101378 [Plicaturopsis crispa FD-325 SS-3]
MSSPTTTRTHRTDRDNVAEAVRDTVTLRDQGPQPRTTTKTSRTQNTGSTPQPASRPNHNTHRALSQDSVTQAAAALEKAKKGRAAKKGSMHADVIDRLDFTGVGPMFHHDGPFDACAPSRNRHRTKAPMLAWSGGEPPPDLGDLGNIRGSNDGPYPSDPHTYAPYDPPKKKVDAIAEAWGTHEPEPYEDFSAGGGTGNTPASSIYNGREGHASPPSAGRTTRRKEGREPRDGEGRKRAGSKRTPLPPPQPIFMGEDQPVLSPPPPSSPNGTDMKRNRSLMHRIRKMRDSPNVPATDTEDGAYYTSPPSPGERERPSHRHQNSFLGGGRRTATPSRKGDNISPTSDGSDAYVHVDNSRPSNGRDQKSLPATPGGGGTAYTPGEDNADDYFDQNALGTSPNGGGLGRKTSLLKKVRGVVRGNK